MGLLKLAEQSLIESKFTNPSHVGVFRDARSACGVMVAYSPEAHPVQPTLAIALQGREAATICHMSNRFKGAAAAAESFLREGEARPFQKIKWCKWAVNDRDQRRVKNGEGSGN